MPLSPASLKRVAPMFGSVRDYFTTVEIWVGGHVEEGAALLLMSCVWVVGQPLRAPESLSPNLSAFLPLPAEALCPP